jgi:histidine triad (HIT) family protein
MSDCIFCKIIEGKIPSYKVYEDENTFAFLDIHPASRYHTLVVPKKHFDNIFDTPSQDLQQIMIAIKKITDLYKTKLGIENLQILNSSGSEAQQDVFHTHFHIIPRSLGDGQDGVH